MTDEDSVMLARTLWGSSKSKKKKRSHIRFGVTILDTGNERRESIAKPRLPRKTQGITGQYDICFLRGLLQSSNETSCSGKQNHIGHSASYGTYGMSCSSYHGQHGDWRTNAGGAWYTWHFAICLGMATDESTRRSANYSLKGCYVVGDSLWLCDFSYFALWPHEESYLLKNELSLGDHVTHENTHTRLRYA